MDHLNRKKINKKLQCSGKHTAPLAILMFFFAASALPAQIKLSDPPFPAKESITYIRSSESGSEMVSVEMRLVRPSQNFAQSAAATPSTPSSPSSPSSPSTTTASTPANRPGSSTAASEPHYEYRMKSNSKDMLVKLAADTLEVFYSEVTLKNSHSTIHRTNQIIENKKRVNTGELLVSDGNGLDTSLRGFPWQAHDEAKLVFLNGSDKFKLGMKVVDRETLKLNNTSYDCYKVQLGLDGFIGSFFPKSFFWYSVDPPHILVRAENAGMMGEEASVLELVSYSASN